jgi:hypothetical protein
MFLKGGCVLRPVVGMLRAWLFRTYLLAIKIVSPNAALNSFSCFVPFFGLTQGRTMYGPGVSAMRPIRALYTPVSAANKCYRCCCYSTPLHLPLPPPSVPCLTLLLQLAG